VYPAIGPFTEVQSVGGVQDNTAYLLSISGGLSYSGQTCGISEITLLISNLDSYYWLISVFKIY
jgi:hypothetical protein